MTEQETMSTGDDVAASRPPEPPEPPEPPRPADDGGSGAGNGRADRGDRFKVILSEFGSAVLSVVVALMIGAVLIVVTDEDSISAWSSFFTAPGEAFSASWSIVSTSYSALLTNSVGSIGAFSETLTRAAPLSLMGLSVSLAFRSGLFNMGGQAQFLAGTLGAVWVAFSMPDSPVAVVLVLSCLMGALCGAVMGSIPGILKARTGAHEVIITLMLNAMMVFFVSWILTTSTFQQPGQTAPLSKPALVQLPRILGDGNRANVGTLIAIAAALLMLWTLTRTTLGFRVRMVGANRVAARYAGVSLGAVFIAVMTVAGALSGLAGAIEVLGVQGSVFPGIDGSYFLGGIAVALLGRTHAIGVLLAALLFGAMQAGGLAMQSQTGVSVDIVSVVQALVVVFVAVPMLLQKILHVRYQAAPQQLSKGWGG